MYRRRTERIARAIVAAVALGTALASCSSIYYDRRDPISPFAGDAVAANAVAQMYNPMPRSSASVNFPADGQRAQRAIERYHSNRVVPPINPTTSGVQNQQLQTQAAAAASAGQSNAGGTAPVAPPAAPQ
jgi:hypothetical protein